MKHKYKNIALDFIYDIIGTFIYNTGVFCFVDAAHVAPGGMSGVSIMLNYLYRFPIGTTTLLLNIPVLILGWIYLGRRMVYKTMRTLVISTILMDTVISQFIPQYSGDRLISCIFGGALMGAGLTIVFMRGSTTGGTDILSNLVKRKYPQIPIGRAILFIDCVIISISILVFADVEAGLYGLISLFCCTKIIDSLLYGLDRSSSVMIISPEYEQIADKIMNTFGRGVTCLRASGAYTKNEKTVLLCVCRRQEYFKMKSLVYKIDKNAFVIVSEVNEVIGEGFRSKQ